MKPGRFYPIAIAMLLALTLAAPDHAEAFWGFGGDRASGRNGLDFDQGYDVNTVTTVTGRALAVPHAGDGNNVIVEVASGTEIVNLCVGPGAFWEKHGIRISKNDVINAKGSKAQGKDGKTYLLVQWVTDQATGAQAVLRDDNGKPAWRGARDTFRTEHSPARSGGMGGRMMRGGGGMMRR